MKYCISVSISTHEQYHFGKVTGQGGPSGEFDDPSRRRNTPNPFCRKNRKKRECKRRTPGSYKQPKLCTTVHEQPKSKRIYNECNQSFFHDIYFFTKKRIINYLKMKPLLPKRKYHFRLADTCLTLVQQPPMIIDLSQMIPKMDR